MRLRARFGDAFSANSKRPGTKRIAKQRRQLEVRARPTPHGPPRTRAQLLLRPCALQHTAHHCPPSGPPKGFAATGPALGSSPPGAGTGGGGVGVGVWVLVGLGWGWPSGRSGLGARAGPGHWEVGAGQGKWAGSWSTATAARAWRRVAGRGVAGGAGGGADAGVEPV